MRRTILLLCLATSISAQDTLDWQRHYTIDLWKHLDAYTRSLFGCPVASEITAANCHPGRGVQDYGEFLKARKAAKQLFQLSD